MGGHGSGRSSASSRATTSDHRWLDVMYLARRDYLRPGLMLTLSWSRRDGTTVASIGLRVVSERAIELAYSVRRADAGDEWESITEQVDLDWTPSRLGGRRPWFLCPGARCGRRVARLYQGRRYFVCRTCLDLTYESRSENDASRALRRAQAIRQRLGGSGSMMEPFPDKPPRMHWTTYSRLRTEAEACEGRQIAWIEQWLSGVDRFIAGRERSLGRARRG